MGDSPESQIQYDAYTPSDAEVMAKLLAEVFSRYDPPAVATGLTAPEFEAFVRLLYPRVAADGVTIVARLGDSGEMVGALLATDSASTLPDGMERLTVKFDPIFSFLRQLESEYRGGKEVHPFESIHLILLGVSDRAARRGVAQQLVAACLEQGRRRGYRFAVTEATNQISQHIFRKQGFIERVKKSYKAYRFDGRRVFASIAEHGGPILMDKAL